MDMREVPFVDAHVHFWDLAHLRYPWLRPPFDDAGPNGSVAPIAHTYRPEDYRAEALGWRVAGAVHVDAGADPADAVRETQWLKDEAARTGLPDAIVAFADLSSPDLEAVLGAHRACPRVRGIRHIVNWHPDPRRSYTPRDLTIDPAWRAGFAALARHGLSFDLQCYPAQMSAVAALAERHPEVPVVINHLGMPVLTDPDGLDAWRAGLAALSRLPQVSIKLSGLGFIRRDWTPAMTTPLIREAIDLFGPERALAASDFPTDRLFASFDRALGALADAIAPYSDNERRAIWGGNACRVYRIDPAILGETA